MKPVNQTACKTLDILAELAARGDDRAAKIDTRPSAFMAVHVEQLPSGILSVAHYFEQNGDLVPDPEMEFWKGPDGRWYPVSINQQFGAQRAVWFGADGQPERLAPRAQRDLASFAATWLRNIRQQQQLQARRAA
jgi:hypothetical protein